MVMVIFFFIEIETRPSNIETVFIKAPGDTEFFKRLPVALKYALNRFIPYIRTELKCQHFHLKLRGTGRATSTMPFFEMITRKLLNSIFETYLLQVLVRLPAELKVLEAPAFLNELFSEYHPLDLRVF